jgi:hypothetical protein
MVAMHTLFSYIDIRFPAPSLAELNIGAGQLTVNPVIVKNLTSPAMPSLH